MTAQISDGFFFDNEEYYEIAISKPIAFSPKRYGLHPVPPSTACWRGYWCDYEITKDAFTLKNLHIRDRDGKYPQINGVNAVPDDMGTFAYFDLDKRLSYTGNIILGNGFLQQYYVHMGFQSAWAFEVVKEFVIKRGALVEIRDFSEQMVEFRKLIDKDPEGFYQNMHRNIPQFVEDCFSQEYATKAWWLKELD